MATVFNFNIQDLSAMSRKELTNLAKQTGACKANAKSESIIKALTQFAQQNENTDSENIENKQSLTMVPPEPVEENTNNEEATNTTDQMVPEYTEDALQDMKKAELVKLAKACDLDVESKITKAKLVELLAAHYLTQVEPVIVAKYPGEYTVKWDGSEGRFGLKLKWNQMQLVVCGFTAEAAMKDAAEGHSAASVFIGSVITAINGSSTAGRSYTDVTGQLQKCKGKGTLTFLKPMAALKSVDSLDTDLEDLLSKFTNVMHITKTAALEPRIMCEATKKELIPDLEEVKNHVSSDQFKEGLQEMNL